VALRSGGGAAGAAQDGAGRGGDERRPSPGRHGPAAAPTRARAGRGGTTGPGRSRDAGAGAATALLGSAAGARSGGGAGRRRGGGAVRRRDGGSVSVRVCVCRVCSVCVEGVGIVLNPPLRASAASALPSAPDLALGKAF